MKLGMKWVVMSVALLVLFSVVAESRAAQIQSWAAMGQRLTGASETGGVKVVFALIDKDGKMKSGLKQANFKLYSTMALGLATPGAFTFTILENSSPKGTYTMVIKPGTDNKWQAALAYRFSFVAAADATTNGLGEVLIINLAALSESVNESGLGDAALSEKGNLLMKLLMPQGQPE